MGNTRKYNLNLNDIMSCGIGTYTGTTIQCNILNSFTVKYDTIPPTSCIYPTISLDNLKSLSVFDYNKRVLDYLDMLELENEAIKERLFNEASVDDVDCTYKCQLNPDFLVYKFLSGVRIVNIGIPNGIIQYKIYPINNDPNDYSWQTNPTFLGLNQNGIYVAIIRDYFNGSEICTYSKIISMSLLMGSTTTTLMTKIISLKETNYICDATTIRRTGSINIVPALSLGEKVEINFVATASTTSCNNACVQFTCKPNNLSPVNYCCIKNAIINPVCGQLSFCYGDTMCYNVTVINNTYASVTNSKFCLSSVNGLNIFNPVIDITNNFASVSRCIEPLNVLVSFSGKTTTITSLNTTVNGIIKISPPIPQNEHINISLYNINCANTITSNSTTNIYKRGINDSTYSIYCSTNKNCSQPQRPIIVANYGDSFCYTMALNVNNGGDITNGTLSITGLTSSIGINPIINGNVSGVTVYETKSIVAIPVVVNVCRQYSISNQSSGYINVVPPLLGSQYVTLNYSINQLACTNQAVVHLFCKPNGGSNFMLKCSYCTNSINCIVCSNYYTGNIKIEPGDCVCYYNCLFGGGMSRYMLTSVAGSLGMTPTIGAGKNMDCLICS